MYEVKIYTLSSNRNINDIRYVGKTTQKLKRRLQGHLCDARKSKKEHKNNYVHNWINEEINAGYEIVIEEIDSMIFENKDNWKWLERYWISQMKIWGFNLTNYTEGGEDNYLPNPTQETIRKRANKIIGIERDLETKQKISKSLKGIKRSEETKEKVRKSIIDLQGRSIQQFDKNGKFIKEWEGCATAARELNLDKSNINSVCRGKRKTCGGFIWMYTDDNLEIDKSNYIVQLDLDGNFIAEYSSAAEAERILKINANLIRRTCKKIQPQTYNFVFKFYKDYYNN